MGTLISWTDETWNFVTGCSRVSDGCTHCYAESLSLRFGWSKKPWTAVNAEANVTCHPDRLRKPYTWKVASRVFVNSMSDLFHERVPDAFIAKGFAVMADLPQHTFQILTKRPENMARITNDPAFRALVEQEYAALQAEKALMQPTRRKATAAPPVPTRTAPMPWPLPNVWLGTTVEDRKAVKRIALLRDCVALTRFLSCEPLLEDLGDLDLSDIHWVIAGGESGLHMRNAPDRWMDHAWARHIRDQCVAQSVAYFFKQSSGVRTEMGTELEEVDGTTSHWQQYPTHLATTFPEQAALTARPVQAGLNLIETIAAEPKPAAVIAQASPSKAAAKPRKPRKPRQTVLSKTA